MKPKKGFHITKALLRFLCVALTLLIIGSTSVCAKEAQKVIRVGWFESSFNQTDDLGRRSGYSYEYQQEIASYTGWRYEYVEGSWSDLLEMLKEGKIDLLSDVSYTSERSDEMMFSSLPMGTEEYYLFTTPDNIDISATDFTTFNGKKIGVNKDSIQAEFFREWEKTNDVNAELIELSGTESENMSKLVSGKIDMYLTLESFVDADITVPVCEIASSDFYFAVSNSRSDILSELNYAMNCIQDGNPFYNQQLYTKYLKGTKVNSYFTSNEIKWLAKHGKIRIGYQDNYLAFCAQDPKTGKLTGALKDYLETASSSIENVRPEFEPIAYPTAQAALDALKKGEVDCVFPVNLTDYYGEVKGYSITTPLMNTEMSAIVSESNQDTLFKKERVTVAVNAGNPNYDMFLLDNIPEWRSVYFEDTAQCLKAISDGRADCLLMSSFRVNDVAEECEKYNLVALNAGVKLDYCIGVRRDNSTLYSILNKMISVVPDNTMSKALSFYAAEDEESAFFSYLKANRVRIIGFATPVVLALLALLWYLFRTRKKAKQSEALISAIETDELTGLYTKNFFFEYANRMYAADPDKPMDGIFINIIRFHAVNAANGRVFGDSVLAAIGEEILDFVAENDGIAGRSDSDQFAIYCPHMTDSRILFERLQKKLDSLSSNTSIRLRMGVMPWENGIDPQELLEHALIACNMARGLYKENLIIFDENMRQKEAFEEQLINDLRRAIDEHELVVYYQPKYDIQTEPPTLHSAEALVRWKHPKFGLIGSSDFIPLFERNGQIGLIDNYVWRETVKQAAKWKEKYNVTIPISVNLSRIDIFDSSLETTFDSLLEEFNLDTDAIEIEVTESAYTENAEELIDIIKSLRKKGYKIQMDDFGTGYSSLNMLSSMPIDALKMDKAFITDLTFSDKQIQLVELILDIAKDLNLPVIAEGVETEEQMLMLKKLGCDIAQGYYFAKPIPPEKFEKRILDK